MKDILIFLDFKQDIMNDIIYKIIISNMNSRDKATIISRLHDRNNQPNFSLSSCWCLLQIIRILIDAFKIL